MKSIVSIVIYRTFCRWTQQKPIQSRQSGRPPLSHIVRSIILRIATQTGWGYTRILGELRKLGIRKVSRATITRVLKENGIEPSPSRPTRWKEFIRSHIETLWACDFFTKDIFTWKGKVTVYILFFIHINSRRVHLAGMSEAPDKQWMAQQARNLCMYFDQVDPKPKIILHDRDSKFTKQFDAILESEGISMQKLPIRSPNLNAYAERWIQSIKVECLDRFLVFGFNHLEYLVCEYVKYYNSLRPDQSLDNRPLDPESNKIIPFENDTLQVSCKSFLGGALKHYYQEKPPDLGEAT
ncbi:MAG: integrase core domain-containing protein [Verrucomicrobiota bacterium]